MSGRAALLWFLLLVPVFNLLTVLALPTVINELVMRRIVTQGLAGAATPDPRPEVAARQETIRTRGGINVALSAAPADATARTVVRPSPDLLYTACVFDLSNGPLHLTAPVQASYVSVSGFAADTSNFFSLNDSQISADSSGQKRIDLLLLHEADAGASASVNASTQRVLSPSKRGLILFRSLITNPAALHSLQQQYQSQQRCDPL